MKGRNKWLDIDQTVGVLKEREQEKVEGRRGKETVIGETRRIDERRVYEWRIRDMSATSPGEIRVR